MSMYDERESRGMAKVKRDVLVAVERTFAEAPTTLHHLLAGCPQAHIGVTVMMSPDQLPTDLPRDTTWSTP